MATVLADLAQRIGAMAEAEAGSEEDGTAQSLFEVERSLRGALRRLEGLRS